MNFMYAWETKQKQVYGKGNLQKAEEMGMDEDGQDSSNKLKNLNAGHVFPYS
jgi:hypothetical protein